MTWRRLEAMRVSDWGRGMEERAGERGREVKGAGVRNCTTRHTRRFENNGEDAKNSCRRFGISVEDFVYVRSSTLFRADAESLFCIRNSCTAKNVHAKHERQHIPANENYSLAQTCRGAVSDCVQKHCCKVSCAMRDNKVGDADGARSLLSKYLPFFRFGVTTETRVRAFPIFCLRQSTGNNSFDGVRAR